MSGLCSVHHAVGALLSAKTGVRMGGREGESSGSLWFTVLKCGSVDWSHNTLIRQCVVVVSHTGFCFPPHSPEQCTYTSTPLPFEA